LTASLDKTEAELKAAQTKISELDSNLGKTETELAAVDTEYKEFKSKIAQKWTSLDRYLDLSLLIFEIDTGIIFDDTDMIENASSSVIEILDTLNEPALQKVWGIAFVRDGDSWTLNHMVFTAFKKTYLLRIDSKREVFREYFTE